MLTKPTKPTHKKCRRCGATKHLSLFKKAAKRAFGVSSWCSDCSNEHYRENQYSAKRWKAMKAELAQKGGE